MAREACRDDCKDKAARKPPMKAYASLPEEDIAALVAYLETLKKK
jgi:cytochrome c553